MATLQESVLAPACVSSVAFHLPSVAPVWIKMEEIFFFTATRHLPPPLRRFNYIPVTVCARCGNMFSK